MLRLFFLVLFAFGSEAFAARHLVLVPGFFSSAIPAPGGGIVPWKPYFSRDIVKYLELSGDRVWVVDNLSPLGSVEENGQRLIRFLDSHAGEMAGQSLLLIAHSAGGLYSVYAAAHSNHPIDHIITVATPFQGLKFLETLDRNHIPVEDIVTPICLENLLGLREKAVVDFLGNIRFHRPLRLDVWAGYQKASPVTWNWRFLSAPILPIHALTTEKSDGVVTVKSALAATPLLGRKANLNLQIHHEPIGLEHWEFNLDADFAIAYGVLNISSLRNAQEWAYYKLLKESGY